VGAADLDEVTEDLVVSDLQEEMPWRSRSRASTRRMRRGVVGEFAQAVQLCVVSLPKIPPSRVWAEGLARAASSPRATARREAARRPPRDGERHCAAATASVAGRGSRAALRRRAVAIPAWKRATTRPSRASFLAILGSAAGLGRGRTRPAHWSWRSVSLRGPR